MKWSVVGGTGAMGAVFASSLVANGEEVALLGVSPVSIDAINTNGLVITDKFGETKSYSIRATDDAAQIGVCDVVIFLTKAHHTLAAARSAGALVGSRTVVLTLQNGWGNSDILAEVFEPHQILMGVTYQGATVTAPGQVNHTLLGPTFIGPHLDGAPLEIAEEIGAVMNAAGLDVIVTDQVKTEVWKKLALNAAGLPVAALTRLTTGKLGEDPEIFAICESIAREAVSVARARGYSIDPDERVTYVRNLISRGGGGKASMLQDVEARRKTEIEVINGAIVREAEALGIDVPINRLMVTLIRGLEASWKE